MMKTLLIVVSVFMANLQSDVTGQWKGNISEQFDIAVQLHADHNRLTAKISSQIGETVFENGKVSGDSLSFLNVSFNGITLSSLKGKVKNDSIKFVVTFQGQDMAGVLTRVK